MSDAPKRAKGRGKPLPFSHVQTPADMRAMSDAEWREYKRWVDAQYLDAANRTHKARAASGMAMARYYRALAVWKEKGSQGRPPLPPYEKRLPSWKQRDFLRQLLNEPDERSVMAFLDFALANVTGYGMHPELRPGGCFLYGVREWQQGITLFVKGRNAHGNWRSLERAMYGLLPDNGTGRDDLVETVDGRWIFVPLRGGLDEVSADGGGSRLPATQRNVDDAGKLPDTQSKAPLACGGINVGRMTIEELEASIGAGDGE